MRVHDSIIFLKWLGDWAVRIASKINVALLCTFACATLASSVVLNTTIQPQFDEIERASALINHKRVTDAFEAATEKLQTATQDYAFWDESYGFMQGENADEFVTSNLQPEFKAVDNLGVNALIFQNTDGTVRWGAAFDLTTEASIDGLVKEIAHFSHSHPSLGGTSAEATRGLIRTSQDLLFVAIAPVLKGDRSGPGVGRVISAKLLDIEAIQQLTGVSFNIMPLAKIFDHTSPSAGIELVTQDTQIETKSLINSIVGRPLMYLHAHSPRDVSRAGMIAIQSAMLMMVLAALFTMGILWVFLKRSVVSRVEGLEQHFTTAGVSGEIKTAPVDGSHDEINDLTKSFNAMADQVNHLRDALADSAYMSGLSEWAAGTLHNVRNGLVPITAASWQTEQLFGGAWIKNIETAASEYADDATPPDRREKLNAFLVGSATRFVDAAKQTHDLTDRIKGASNDVLGMVNEFERYAHRKTELEAVELLPLIKVAASATIGVRSKYTELVLPAVPATVYGNGIILRQIVSNILVNAVEATENLAKRSRIEISISSARGLDGFTRLAITDNGEGLAPDQLAAIFQRGVSTRHMRAGGLGLHWCANAVKLLGGTIHAESDGPGRGATFVLHLPNFDAVKEAAA